MIKKSHFIAIFAAFFISYMSLNSAYCAGTYIYAPNRVDMVHDPIRNILYITSGADVLRFDLKTKQFLTPFQLGGNLKGIDLSSDANTLAVADNSVTGIFLVNLTTGEARKVLFSWYTEGGAFSIAFCNDGNILVALSTSWVPFFKYNPSTGETITLPTFVTQAMLSSSADGSVIGFAEGNMSDGRWGRYRLNDGNIVERTGYTDGTSWFNYVIGTDRHGAQFAIPTYGGTFIYNSDFVKIATLGEYAGPRPIGVVYNPVEDVVYFAWAQTTEVRAFDTTNFSQIKSYDFEHSFNNFINQPYQEGRLKISRDGRLLFAAVDSGIRYVETVAIGDVNGNGIIDLADAIIALQVSSDAQRSTKTHVQADVNGDRKIGIEEALYALQSIARFRNNHNPILDPIYDKTVDEGKELRFSVSATDKDNDYMTFSTSSLPTGASFNADTRTFSWIPTYSQSGVYQATFIVRDDYGGETSQAITISVNDRPQLYTAAEYYPINVGDWHDYADMNGSIVHSSIIGTKFVGAVQTLVEVDWAGVQTYVTSDQNGIKIYGQYSPTYDTEIIFDQPLLILPNSPQLGASQVSTANYSMTYLGQPYHVNVTSTVNIIGIENVQTVNMGFGDCIQISTRLDQFIVERGQYVAGETSNQSYCKGVGLVKQTTNNNIYTMSNYFINGNQNTGSGADDGFIIHMVSP